MYASLPTGPLPALTLFQIAIAGGESTIGPTNRLDFFDCTTQQAKIPFVRLSESRTKAGIAAYGKYLVVAGGYDGEVISKTVDIIDTSDTIRTTPIQTLSLSEARMLPSVVVVESADLFFVAGGQNTVEGGTSDVVDIFSFSTGKRRQASVTPRGNGTLGVKRRAMGSATIGNYVIFLGGEESSGNGFTDSSQVDVYDVTDLAAAPRSFQLPFAFSNSPVAVLGPYLYIPASSTSQYSFSVMDTRDFTIRDIPSRPPTILQPVGVAASLGEAVVFAGGTEAETLLPTSSVSYFKCGNQARPPWHHSIRLDMTRSR